MATSALAVKPVPPVGSAPKPSLGGLEGQLAQQTTQAQKDITGYQDSLGKLTTDFHDEIGKLKELAPKPPSDKPFEAPEQVNPISAFGSSAGLLATLASAFSRTPLTTSLNAMSAGMKSIQDGNALAYNRAYDEWKSNTDYALKTFEAQGKAYDRLLDLSKTDYDGAMNGIKTLASMTNDKAMLTATEMKSFEGVEQLNIERQRLSNELKMNASKMIPGEIFNQSLKEFAEKNRRQPNAQEMSKLWQDTQLMASTASITPEDAKSMAEQYLAGDKSVLQGMGYGNTGAANRALVQHYIRDTARQSGMTGAQIATKIAEFGGLMASERSVGTRAAQVDLAVSELNRVMPLALQASKTVNRGQFVPINTAVQALQRGSSDPNLARFVAANNTLVNVYARAVSPTGVGTVEQRDHAREMLGTATSQQAYEAVVNQMQKEAEAAEAAPADVKAELEDLAGTGNAKNGAQKPPQKDSDVYLTETQSDYDLLDKGAKYRMPEDPPGKYRVK